MSVIALFGTLACTPGTEGIDDGDTSSGDTGDTTDPGDTSGSDSEPEDIAAGFDPGGEGLGHCAVRGLQQARVDGYAEAEMIAALGYSTEIDGRSNSCFSILSSAGASSAVLWAYVNDEGIASVDAPDYALEDPVTDYCPDLTWGWLTEHPLKHWYVDSEAIFAVGMPGSEDATVTETVESEKVGVTVLPAGWVPLCSSRPGSPQTLAWPSLTTAVSDDDAVMLGERYRWYVDDSKGEYMFAASARTGDIFDVDTYNY